MKQFILVILLSLLLSTSAFSKNKKLYFNTQEFTPFNYTKNKKAAGPVVEIIKEVCANIDIECESKVLPWRRAQNEVKNGLADGLFVVGKNAKREEWLYFSFPIINTEYGFFVLDSNKLVYKDMNDIQGYNVGVYGPSNTSNSLKKIGANLIEKNLSPINIRISYDDVLSFKMLNKKDRDIQAVYSNKDVGNELIRQYNLKNIRYAGKQKSLNYFIAFSKKTVSEKIVNKFNNALQEMYHNKKLQKILDKYSLETAKFQLK